MISDIRQNSRTVQRQSTGAPAAQPAAFQGLSLEDKLEATCEQAKEIGSHLNPHVPGEVLVKLKPEGMGMLDSDFVESYKSQVLRKFDLSDQGGLSVRNAPHEEILHLKLPEGVTTEQAIAAMKSDPRVEYAETNDIIQHYQQPVLVDDLQPALWGLHNEGQNGGKVDADIDAPEAWKFTVGKNQSEGAPIIAVIDTGVDYNHPDLKANIWVNPGEIAGNGIDDDGNGVVDDVHGYNAQNQSGDPMDDDKHGTHCSGTIGAVGNNGQGVVGVNHKANIMAVKFLGPNGGTLAGAIDGLLYATKNGARVTSNSWGGGGYNQALKDTLANSPALHIFAAGNERNNNDAKPAYPASYDLPNVISVAATDRNDKLSSFSNWGAKSVDLAAPGSAILSTVPGGQFESFNGTSMACPHVSAVAGLLLAEDATLSNEELRSLLLDSVDQVPALAGKTVTGGRLNAASALKMLHEKSEEK
jgi:subtilisin family serine protease